MTKLKIGLLLLVFAVVGVQAKRLGLKFDINGKMVSPDDYLVHQALIDDQDGYKNDAMWRLKEAAEYGNKHGQYYAGLLHLQKDDYVNGYAWLKLAGDKFMNNANLLPGIEQELQKREQMGEAKQVHQALTEEINFDSALAKRLQWRKRLKFAGSHIGGFVPVFWSTELRDGLIVKSFQVKQEIDQFIYDYRYESGNVKLKELRMHNRYSKY